MWEDNSRERDQWTSQVTNTINLNMQEIEYSARIFPLDESSRVKSDCLHCVEPNGTYME